MAGALGFFTTAMLYAVFEGVLTLVSSIILSALCLWIIFRIRGVSVFEELRIPGPKPNFIFGNILEILRKNPLKCHEEWIKKYGKIVGFYLGTKPTVMVTDPKLLREIFINDFSKFANRPHFPVNDCNALGKRFARHVASSRGKKWKEMRAMLSTAFTADKLKSITPIVNNRIDVLLQNVGTKARNGEVFDAYRMYQQLTVDVISRIAYGSETECQNGRDKDILKAARILISGCLWDPKFFLPFIFPGLSSLWVNVCLLSLNLKNRSVESLQNVFTQLKALINMRRRREKEERRTDLLQFMLDAQICPDTIKSIPEETLAAKEEKLDSRVFHDSPEEIPGKWKRRMSEDEILSNAFVFLTAGFDTTSIALAFTTHLLVHHPEIQEKVHKEVKDLVGTDAVLDYTTVHQLQYLDQVFKESLRLYPPVYFFTVREAAENVDYKGLKLRPEISVMAPTYALHRDPTHWENPEKFDPERTQVYDGISLHKKLVKFQNLRYFPHIVTIDKGAPIATRFSPENKGKIDPVIYQPFGIGPRNCIGMRLAQTIAKLTLAKLLLNYRLVRCSKTDKEKLSLRIASVTLAPARGVHVKAEPI